MYFNSHFSFNVNSGVVKVQQVGDHKLCFYDCYIANHKADSKQIGENKGSLSWQVYVKLTQTKVLQPTPTETQKVLKY